MPLNASKELGFSDKPTGAISAYYLIALKSLDH